MCPHPYFQFLEKFCIFSLVLAKILALKMQIFQIFIPKTPHVSRKIHSLDPIFGNPCGTHAPRKSWMPHPQNALCNSAVAHQHGNHSNNKLSQPPSCGYTLTSSHHTDGLFCNLHCLCQNNPKEVGRAEFNVATPTYGTVAYGVR